MISYIEKSLLTWLQSIRLRRAWRFQRFRKIRKKADLEKRLYNTLLKAESFQARSIRLRYWLVCHWKLLGVNQVPSYVSKYPFFVHVSQVSTPCWVLNRLFLRKLVKKPMTKYSISFYMKLCRYIKCSLIVRIAYLLVS